MNYTRPHREFYDTLLETFDDLQLCLVEIATDLPVALVNCVPVPCQKALDSLPQEGGDWLVETGGTANGEDANVLGALAISVPESERGKGYATRIIRELRELSERRGFDAVIAPVRPTAKCDYPRVPIGEYVGWKDAQGRVFD